MSNSKMWELNKRLYRTLDRDAMLGALDELSDLAAEREKFLELIAECDTYLDTNNLTQIGSGSILHQKMKAAIALGNDV